MPTLCLTPGCPNARPCPQHPVNRWAAGASGRQMPPGWTTTRTRILRRDNHQCYQCGAPATEVDHLTPGGGEHEANLAAICTPCHRAKSSAEGQAQRW